MPASMCSWQDHVTITISICLFRNGKSFSNLDFMPLTRYWRRKTFCRFLHTKKMRQAFFCPDDFLGINKITNTAWVNMKLSVGGGWFGCPKVPELWDIRQSFLFQSEFQKVIIMAHKILLIHWVTSLYDIYLQEKSSLELPQSHFLFPKPQARNHTLSIFGFVNPNLQKLSFTQWLWVSNIFSFSLFFISVRLHQLSL